jgi:hypothetical protein
MVVAIHARVLAQIILVLCFAAGMAASCIIFVLYGPVPVRRKVTIVPRLSPVDPFAQHRAAALISLPAQPPALQQQVAPGIAFVMPQGSQPVAVAAVEPPRPPQKPEPMVAPLKLRRPRGESPGARVHSPPLTLRPHGASPPPLPRNRSARGTERKPRPSELDVTAVRSFDQHRTFDNNPENTLETPLVSFDDDQFLEDGR